eukprot:16769-Heterococcus_DN1.PRE.1
MRASICAAILLANRVARAWVAPAVELSTSLASARTLHAARLPHRRRVRAHSSNRRSALAAAAAAMNADQQPGQAVHTVVLVRHGLSTFNK